MTEPSKPEQAPKGLLEFAHRVTIEGIETEIEFFYPGKVLYASVIRVDITWLGIERFQLTLFFDHKKPRAVLDVDKDDKPIGALMSDPRLAVFVYSDKCLSAYVNDDIGRFHIRVLERTPM